MRSGEKLVPFCHSRKLSCRRFQPFQVRQECKSGPLLVLLLATYCLTGMGVDAPAMDLPNSKAAFISFYPSAFFSLFSQSFQPNIPAQSSVLPSTIVVAIAIRTTPTAPIPVAATAIQPNTNEGRPRLPLTFP